MSRSSEVPGVLARLAEAAAGEEPPRLDVAGRVLRTIAAARARRAAPGEAALLGMAAVSATAAAVAAALAWQALADPMVSFMGALTWVMM
jgi:hypothetical protein